jgi:hypothetical protein
MITRRPSIFIYTHDADEDFLREIRAGIEEEGIYSETYEREDADPDTLAFEAARDSMLGSGIGVAGVDIALQMRGLKKGSNAAFYHMPTFQQCRDTGANSARIIKKLGLKDQ